jgi:hypothetical protein
MDQLSGSLHSRSDTIDYPRVAKRSGTTFNSKAPAAQRENLTMPRLLIRNTGAYASGPCAKNLPANMTIFTRNTNVEMVRSGVCQNRKVLEEKLLPELVVLEDTGKKLMEASFEG